MKLVGIYGQFRQSGVFHGHLDGMVEAIADDCDFGELTDMLVERQKAGIELNAAEEAFQRYVVGLDHAQLLLHALHGGDMAIEPLLLDIFPFRSCKTLQHGIHGLPDGQGAIEINDE